jgi:hypothetical protein
MNRNRWVPVAAIVTVAVLAVLAVIAAVIGVSLRSNDSSASGPPSLGNREAFDGSRTVPVPVTTDSPPFG